ncbi:hypothetical protein BRETT_002631 [Brettanomyces bruxellensis]|uniref:Uncharacterized protein n=1 Tax=Dekkera bruxellensis TaxID=5007 RepID=A0A871RJB8_DEKBR|nr:uncharacterized protein BRETT_002631 [Brettanomyces bruxellensis]QOU22451.1 hypothetical protein BRETT_002631 [Brettanomyces bruxellensis]
MGSQAFADIDPTLWAKRKQLSRQKKELDKIAYGKKRREERANNPDLRTSGVIWKQEGITKEALLKEIRALKKKNREYELKNAKLRSECDIKREEMSCLRKKIGDVSRDNRSWALRQSKLVQENKQLKIEVSALRRKLGKHLAERVSMQAQYSALVSELGNNENDEENEENGYYDENEGETDPSIGIRMQKEDDTDSIYNDRNATTRVGVPASEMDTTQLLNLDPFSIPRKKSIQSKGRFDSEDEDMDTEKLLSI